MSGINRMEYTMTHSSYYMDKINDILEWLQNRGYDAKLSRYSKYKGYIDAFYKGNPDDLSDLGTRFKKLNEAFQECVQIVQVYEAFKDEESKGFAERLDKVVYGNDFYNSEKKSDQARDFLYELLVASWFKRWGYAIDFEQITDVVARKNGKTVYVECKRIKSVKALEENFKKACKQLERVEDDTEHYGLVFIDVYNCLGHEFQTDVAHIKFVDFEITKPDVAWTILYSMLEGLSRYMCIDRNELSGCLQWYRDSATATGNFGFVLFDNTPGGAGYVRQLKDPVVLANMLQEGFRVVNNCSCGAGVADTACYSCLCNYYNQKQHDILKRKYAIDFYLQFALEPDGEWEATRNEEIYMLPVAEPMDSVDVVRPNDDESLDTEHYQIQFCNEGQNQMSETTHEIWENLLEDCDDDEYSIIHHLLEHSDIEIEKPVYRESVMIIETQERFFADQIWKEKKVMLFLTDSAEDYEIAQKTGWKCYCTKAGFDVEEFLERIKV